MYTGASQMKYDENIIKRNQFNGKGTRSRGRNPARGSIEEEK